MNGDVSCQCLCPVHLVSAPQVRCVGLRRRRLTLAGRADRNLAEIPMCLPCADWWVACRAETVTRVEELIDESTAVLADADQVAAFARDSFTDLLHRYRAAPMPEAEKRDPAAVAYLGAVYTQMRHEIMATTLAYAVISRYAGGEPFDGAGGSCPA